MISRRVLPSARRFSTYSMVVWSQRIRVVAIRHKALLAWRSPPRLRRWRTIGPEDAWTGLAPHRAAKDASDLMRSGLSPAATNKAAAVSGPIPVVANSAGLARAQRWLIWVSSSPISAVRVWYLRAKRRRTCLA